MIMIWWVYEDFISGNDSYKILLKHSWLQELIDGFQAAFKIIRSLENIRSFVVLYSWNQNDLNTNFNTLSDENEGKRMEVKSFP